ncbi:TerB family tellurite resistance protein [Falsiroseomonas oryzae]|uniref:TerB family tellurite resistance protein n=1 Tax=Falsiroseomonas oryzae TaxID=2766473 RepID=UPI0022EAB9E4|nr:TerB family tellurite resistance protein [Roseomonas sp. MO-31]
MFNLFKSQAPAFDLTPRNCLVASLLYCMASDGEMDEEEVGHLLSVMGPNATREALNTALRFCRATPAEQFAQQAAQRLRPDQKLCIVLNMIDSAMSDGEAEPQEQQLVMGFIRTFGLSEAELEPHFRTLTAKNDRAVLDR